MPRTHGAGFLQLGLQAMVFTERKNPSPFPFLHSVFSHAEITPHTEKAQSPNMTPSHVFKSHFLQLQFLQSPVLTTAAWGNNLERHGAEHSAPTGQRYPPVTGQSPPPSLADCVVHQDGCNDQVVTWSLLSFTEHLFHVGHLTQ